MRCKENTGFLLLRRCENAAMFQCCYCGKDLCGEHATAVGQAPPPTPSPPTEGASADALPLPPMAGQAVSCQACLRKQQQPTQQRGAVYGDYYYHYPYYGSYRPYHWGHDFDDRDRRVFDRQRVTQPDATPDALGS